MRFVVGSTLIAVIWASFATPATAGPLQPTTSWNLDYGDTRCTAARSYGSASDPVTLGIVPSFNGQIYKLIVSQERTGPTFAKQMQGMVDFGHGRLKTGLLHYGGKGVKLSNYEFRVSSAAIEQARSATEVALRADNGIGYDFALAEMPALLDALSKCTADLQRYWNFGQRTTTSLANDPKADIRSIFRGDDYPTEALMRMQGGKGQYQLLVDEKGAVAGCELLVQSEVPIIDVMGCQVMKERARFSPAMDSNGKAVRSVVTTPPIVWRVEEGPSEGPTLTGRYVSQ
jgi:hypothetical protein